jgi:NAD(P)-dependent dehydrogenase (short-subunit alcohol dehydrogenase family)
MKKFCDNVRRLICIVLLLATGLPLVAVAEIDPDAPTVLITGSNRGIGLEFTRQYAALGWNVIATCRRPGDADALASLAEEYPNITIEQLDVLRHDMIDAVAKKYKKQPIDVLLNNAGFFGDMLQMSGSFFSKLDYSLFELYVETNAIGPLKMAEAFFENVKMSDQKKIMTVSSQQGSIEDSYGPGSFFYRGSKATLNMFMHTLAEQSKVKNSGVMIGLFSPGLIIDDRTRNLPLEGKVERPISVTAMIGVIEDFTPEMSGGFYKYGGQPVPW